VGWSGSVNHRSTAPDQSNSGIRDLQRMHDSLADLRATYDLLRADRSCALLDAIRVRAGDHHPIVLLEGHTRLTAMALAPDCLPNEVPGLLGTSAAISDWPCY